MDFKNYKLLKTEYPAKAEEYQEVAKLLNQWNGEYNQERYRMVETEEYYQVEAIIETPEEKAARIRNLRDMYLTTQVDPVVCNSLRWESLSNDEKQQYRDYRQYLLDIPQQEQFPDVDVLDFEGWKNAS